MRSSRVQLLRAAPYVAVLAFAAGCVAPRPSAEPLSPPSGPKAAKTAKHGSHAQPAPAAEEPGATAQKEADAAAAPAPKPAETPRPAERTAEEKKPADVKQRAAAFTGDYRGEDVATYHVEGAPDRTERDPNARLTVKSSGDGQLDFILVDSSNGNEICTLGGSIAEPGAAVAAGQRCFEQNSAEASVSAKVTHGTATVDGSRLVLQLSLDFQMTFGDRTVSGTLDYRFEGSRRR